MPDTTVEACRCGEPVRPCGHGPVFIGAPPRQPWIAWCDGWLHALTGSHRCHWPAGEYGPEGAARPAEVTVPLPVLPLRAVARLSSP